MARPNTILLPHHVPGRRQDRVYQALSSLGVELAYCNPVEGGILADPGPESLAAVVYEAERTVNGSCRCDVPHDPAARERVTAFIAFWRESW